MFKGLNAQCPPIGETIIDIVTSDCETFEYVISNTEGDWDGFTFALYNIDQENCMPIGLPSNNQVFPPFDPPVYEPGGQWSHAGPTTACMNNGNWGPVLAPVLYKQKWLVDSAIVIQGYNEAITCDPDGDFVDFFIPQELGCKSIDSISTSKQSGDYFDCGCTNVLGTIHYSDGTSYDFDFNVNLECDIDVDPPVCNIQDRVFQGMIGESVEIDVNALAQYYIDNNLVYNACGDVSFSIAMNIATDQPLPDTLSLACGESMDAMFFFTDESGYDCSSMVNISVECEEAPDSPAVDTTSFYKLIGSDSDDIPRKIEFYNGHYYILGYQGQGDNRYGFIRKYNDKIEEVWSFILPEGTIPIDFYFEEDRIVTTGYTLPLDAYNKSVLSIIQDQGTSFLIQVLELIDFNGYRQALRAIVPIEDNVLANYAILGNDGAGSEDDVRLMLFDEEGIFHGQRNYDFGDDQLWNGLKQDLNGSVSFYGNEANDADEGFLINADPNSLAVLNGYSFNGIDMIRDMAIDFQDSIRVMVANSQILSVDKDFQPIRAFRMEGIQLLRNIYGPFLEGNDKAYYWYGQAEINDTIRPIFGKSMVDGDLITLEWAKYIPEMHDDLLGGHFQVLDQDKILFAGGRLDTLNGFGGYDIFISALDTSSCYLEDAPISFISETFTTEEKIINQSTPAAPEIIDTIAQFSEAFECFAYEPCVVTYDSCSVSFEVTAVNCNILTFDGTAEGFLTDSLVSYSYTISNGAFTTMQQDTTIDFTGFFGKEEICLEATDGACTAVFCDSVDLFQPFPPVFEECPDSVRLAICEIEIPLELFGNLLAIEPCDFTPLNVTVTRSDSLELTAPYTLGETTLTATATANGLQSECTWTVELIDTFPPICIVKDTVLYLDEMGQAFLTSDELDLDTEDNCTPVIFNEAFLFDCSMNGDTLLSFMVSDTLGNSSKCESTISILSPPRNIEIQTELIDCREFTISLSDPDFLLQEWTISQGGESLLNEAFDGAFDFQFPENGNYAICVVLEDQNGCMYDACIDFTVDMECDKCDIIFEAVGYECYTLDFRMDAFDFRPEVEYQWSVNGVYQSNEESFFFDFQGPGEHEVCLFAKDLICEATYCFTYDLDTVYAVFDNCPTEKIVLSVNENCEPVPYTEYPELLEFCNKGDQTPNDIIYTRSDGLPISAPYELGVTEIHASFTDYYGIESTCDYEIEVMDEIAPVCLTQDVAITLDESGFAQINEDLVDVGSYDNCDLVSRSLSQYEFTCDEVGEQNVDLILSDGINQSVCPVNVSIIDEVSPVCDIQSTTLYLDESGQRSFSENDLNVTLSDNCGIGAISLSKDQLSCMDIGEQQIVLTALDINGNESVCEVPLTVLDTIAPTCNIDSILLYLDEMGQTNLEEELIAGSVSDNCSTPLIDLPKTQFDCMDLGTQTISMELRDDSGNMSNCPIEIVVFDTIPPLLYVSDIVVIATSEFGAMVDFEATASDNCGEVSITYSIPSGDELACGEYDILATATDPSGNQQSRSFKVNVIECEACCLSENVFNQVINQGFSMEAMFENGVECMAQLLPPDLTDCQVITRIKWGDGTVTTGEFPDDLEFTHEYLGPGSYEVCVTIAEALEDYCFEKEICGYFQISEGCSVITRIEELDKEEVILVPNPAKDRLRILSNEKWTSFQIFDLKGSVYQDLSMSENEIDLSKLESGLYYIRLINTQQSIVKAFVKTD
jgi:hypothetical protein